MALTSSPPTGGPYEGLDPGGFFGEGPKGPSSGSPFFRTKKGQAYGAGMYNLPDAFRGWSGPSKYAFAPAMSYWNESQGVSDFFKGEMGKDYYDELYGRSADIYEGQQKDARRRGEQGLARAGYGGGGAVSPFASLQVQQEAAARAGVLGNAAREAVLQAQAMKASAANNYMNVLASRMQAMLVPAQLQTSRQTRTPLGSVGPSLIGPAMNMMGGFLGAAA